MNRKEEGSFRINVIVKDDDSLRISVVVSPITTVAKLKRNIEQEIHQLHNVTLLVSLLQDSQGFVLSNNSLIGDHLKSNQTLYVQCHHSKQGSSMNLPSNLPDLFLTLRYVSNSVVSRLLQTDVSMGGLEVVPQIIHLGFWYSNVEMVTGLCRLLNKIFSSNSLEEYYYQAHEMQSILLTKVIHFWMVEVKQSYAAFPEVVEQLLIFVQKMSASPRFAQTLKSSHLLKAVVALSKESILEASLKKKALQIVRNITGKGSTNSKSSYLPTALSESALDLTDVEALANTLDKGSQEERGEALQTLAHHPRLMNQLTVRFDYYWKATGLLLMRTVKDKATARVFSEVLRNLTSNTTRSKAAEVMQKDIIRRIHYFLLQSHPDSHSAVFEYYSLLAHQSAKNGVYSVQQATQYLRSPYPSFRLTTAQALAEMSGGKVSAVRFLPIIKDCVKASLKAEEAGEYTALLRTISNLCLDEQCRYQIVNLKGVEVLVKMLEIGESKGNVELQRACSKGLLNLSISSREVKARVLGSIEGILDRYYKGRLDPVAASYIEGILKAPKT